MTQYVLSHSQASTPSTAVESSPALTLSPFSLQNVFHELRQPLSVIESLAYYLELTSADDAACVHLRRIQAMVFEANRILTDASEAA